MIPRENLFFWAGIFAGIFLIGWHLYGGAAEADTHAAAQARQELRRELSAAKACPPGHVVSWTGGSSMECLREVQP